MIRNVGIPSLAMLLVAGSTQAGLIVDNFQSNVIGDAPSGWTIANGGAFTVEGDTYQSPVGAPGDDRGVKLLNDGPQTFERLEQTFIPQTGTFYLQFESMVINRSGACNVQLGDNDYGNSTPGRGINLTLIHWSDDYPQNNGVNLTDFNVSVGNWYRYTLAIDVAADTFDLRVQTLQNASLDKTVTGLAFNNNQAELNIMKFWFNTGNASGGEFALDNVLVTADANELSFAVVPEPSSLALLGIFGLILGLRGRR